jgi:hypothetical protein
MYHNYLSPILDVVLVGGIIALCGMENLKWTFRRLLNRLGAPLLLVFSCPLGP